jgi:hypothetical protein
VNYQPKMAQTVAYRHQAVTINIAITPRNPAKHLAALDRQWLAAMQNQPADLCY